MLSVSGCANSAGRQSMLCSLVLRNEAHRGSPSIKAGYVITNELDLKTRRDRSFKRVLFDLVPEAKACRERFLGVITWEFEAAAYDNMRTSHVMLPCRQLTQCCTSSNWLPRVEPRAPDLATEFLPARCRNGGQRILCSRRIVRRRQKSRGGVPRAPQSTDVGEARRML